MDDLKPLPLTSKRQKLQSKLACIQTRPLIILAVYTLIISFFAGPIILYIVATISVLYIILILIHKRENQTLSAEISHTQYQTLKEISQQYPSISKTISHTLKTQRTISQEQYLLVMELVQQEETNLLKSSLENDS
ncbi:hypothetical protein MNBD_GAMMA12-3093 [hydrothermal vent metagenome]|uniref:Uncharacterized protein n=1 Tax=hydrothermal vent metagenome TaxID=652676 RepID=A0A3B0YPZ9_9ZZZZ